MRIAIISVSIYKIVKLALYTNEVGIMIFKCLLKCLMVFKTHISQMVIIRYYQQQFSFYFSFKGSMDFITFNVLNEYELKWL